MKNETVGDFISRDEAIEALNRRRPKTRGARPKSESLRLADVIVNQMMDAAVIAIENVPASALRAAQPLTRAIELLHAFADHEDQPCSFDHHGYCQEHDDFSGDGCKIAKARALLDSLTDKGE